jgi:hypothetical protein
MEITQDKPFFASMDEVVMKKSELISRLVENKARHDALFDLAVSGYWDTAKDKLQEKRAKLDDAIVNLKEDASIQFGRLEKRLEKKETLPGHMTVVGLKWDTVLGLVYPENHTKDYERAIRMMEASIFSEVRLSQQEFDCYVLNNWEWRERFLASNSTYVDNFRNKAAYTISTGHYQNNVGSQYDSLYANARYGHTAMMLCSGASF